MCRNGCNHSKPSRLRDLLIAIAILLAFLPFAGAPVSLRLHKQIERTQTSWPVQTTPPTTSTELAPTTPDSAPIPIEAPPTPTEAAPIPGTLLPLILGCLAILAFFGFWYWMLRKAQSLHPRTRGYPNYNSTHGGSAL